jgi:hypothetical protein
MLTRVITVILAATKWNKRKFAFIPFVPIRFCAAEIRNG